MAEKVKFVSRGIGLKQGIRRLRFTLSKTRDEATGRTNLEVAQFENFEYETNDPDTIKIMRDQIKKCKDNGWQPRFLEFNEYEQLRKLEPATVVVKLPDGTEKKVPLEDLKKLYTDGGNKEEAVKKAGKPLGSMNKAELVAYAQANQVEATDEDTKDEIMVKIEEAGK